ncbi:hypothetical protein [Paraburkholderia bryophila]|uniref:hypothetical protein n=1 Tax=Paraburkholderia bryophila TaxID=420952 RepID=UPI000DD02F53|nr:hypothetical protein [Paraburkholderia bryophila]
MGISIADVSAVKSFDGGTLGFERPDQPEQDRHAFYTVGRWVAAGFTVGVMISLLVRGGACCGGGAEGTCRRDLRVKPLAVQGARQA